MNEFMGNMQRQGISLLKCTSKSLVQLKKIFTNKDEADADKRVKTNLVIEAVAAAEGFGRYRRRNPKRN